MKEGRSRTKRWRPRVLVILQAFLCSGRRTEHGPISSFFLLSKNPFHQHTTSSTTRTPTARLLLRAFTTLHLLTPTSHFNLPLPLPLLHTQRALPPPETSLQSGSRTNKTLHCHTTLHTHASQQASTASIKSAWQDCSCQLTTT